MATSTCGVASAWDGGEGDRATDWWITTRRSEFVRQAVHDGIDMHDGIETAFERFTVI